MIVWLFKTVVSVPSLAEGTEASRDTREITLLQFQKQLCFTLLLTLKLRLHFINDSETSRTSLYSSQKPFPYLGEYPELAAQSLRKCSFLYWLLDSQGFIHPTFFLYISPQANLSPWSSTSLRLSSRHCSRGSPVGAQRRGCPTPPQVRQ